MPMHGQYGKDCCGNDKKMLVCSFGILALGTPQPYLVQQKKKKLFLDNQLYLENGNGLVQQLLDVHVKGEQDNFKKSYINVLKKESRKSERIPEPRKHPMQEQDCCSLGRHPDKMDCLRQSGPWRPKNLPWLAYQEQQHPYQEGLAQFHFSSYSPHQHEEEPETFRTQHSKTEIM